MSEPSLNKVGLQWGSTVKAPFLKYYTRVVTLLSLVITDRYSSARLLHTSFNNVVNGFNIHASTYSQDSY